MNDIKDQLLAEAAGLERELADNPENPDVLLRVGWSRLQLGDSRAARDALLKAHVLRPNAVVIRIYAARALAECGDYRAPQLIQDWQRWLPLPDRLQFDLADAMQRTDWTQEAVGVLEDLLHRSPEHRWARLLLGSLYERVNRLEDARAVLDAMPAGDGGDTDTGRELTHQQAVLQMRTGRLDEARALLQQVGPRIEGDAEHFFLLGTLADRTDNVDDAMAQLAQAHALQRHTLERAAPQRLQDGAALLPAAEEYLDADAVAQWPRQVAPDAAQSPVFVIGFPRSGTTLVEQMLDAHPALQAMDERPHFDVLADQLEDYGVHVPGDLGRLTQADCDELRKGYLLMACARTPRRWNAQLVDKNPLNMLWLPLILRVFPNARFILMLRNPCDVLLSNYMQDYRSVVMMSISLDLERLAHAYVDAFEHWFHHAAILKPNVVTVRYEDLVADPERTAAQMGGFLGLADASTMLDAARHAREKGFIGTPSYSQVIEPINRQGVDRWLRYRRWFDKPLEILTPVLTRIGYAGVGDA